MLQKPQLDKAIIDKINDGSLLVDSVNGIVYGK